jgi:hypothetical protein
MPLRFPRFFREPPLLSCRRYADDCHTLIIFHIDYFAIFEARLATLMTPPLYFRFRRQISPLRHC